MLIRGLLSTYFWPLLYIVHMFSALKFAQIQFLPFWVTTCEGMVQCDNRYIKAFKGVPGDSAQ